MPSIGLVGSLEYRIMNQLVSDGLIPFAHLANRVKDVGRHFPTFSDADVLHMVQRMKRENAVSVLGNRVCLHPSIDVDSMDWQRNTFNRNPKRLVYNILERLKSVGVTQFQLTPSPNQGKFSRPRYQRSEPNVGGIALERVIPKFLEKREPGNYGNAVSYWQQALRELHYTGYCYYNGQTLIPITTKEKGKPVFVLVSPLGSHVAKESARLANWLGELSGFHVIVKKARPQHAKILRQRFGFEDYRKGEGWNALAPHDDDTFPATVWSTRKLVALRGGSLSRIREKVHKLEREHELSLVPYNPKDHLKEVRSLIRGWSETRGARKPFESKKSAVQSYQQFLIGYNPRAGQNRSFSFVLLLDGKPTGFALLERISPTTVGLYANIASTRINGVPEALVVELSKAMKEKGYSFINAGGSESASLHRFKMHFKPTRTESTPHIVYYPKKNAQRHAPKTRLA